MSKLVDEHTKIDFIAQKLYEHDSDKSPRVTRLSWKFASVRQQQIYRERADCALEALRELVLRLEA